MFLKLRIFFLLILIPVLTKATHIVGGVLNYKYEGGNVYTITLKLYRDCGSSAAAFPGNVTINVRGNNGATFSPNKDLTINLGNVTTIPANLAPCAVAPNPMPCVQEGVYTKTISLPPNTGGYHLYYQVTARNLSLTNINGACNCIGESFYAYIPNNSSSTNNNSNAVFSLFPPLFICVNQPFTVNHSATDLDGDSLAYSLYTPYDGDNGTGPLDPSFPSNTASFTPVNYLSGFTTNNPLGSSPFSLNPLTGVLSGTPALTGQFVVGVRVREYRNGILISQTLRDFQFNVLNCPTPPPSLAVPNTTINNGCSVKLVAAGISNSTSVWTSIAPGATGAYNNFLNCTSNCLQPSVTAVGTPPAYVDFKVCGIATNCLGNYICDTFRVHFNPPLTVSINPNVPSLCNGQTSTTLTALGSGGTPPYNFLWNNVNPTQSVSVGSGTYNVKITDGSGCPPAYNSVVVSSYSVPVAANAGPDQIRCNTSPLATLNATITGATGGVWSGGTGTFSPNNTTTSNLFYTPSATELANGSATLILTTTGNGNCPASTDTVVITYSGFTGTVNISGNPVKCYGGSTGTATVSVNGGFAPHTYLWSSVPSQTTANAGSFSAGNYSVTVTNSIGCTSTNSINITQPAPLNLTATIQPVPCFGGNTGSLNIGASGGNLPYTYTIQPGAVLNFSATALSAGTYTGMVSDSKACTYTSTFAVNAASSITTNFTIAPAKCFGTSTGSVTTIVNGGTTPYTYSWTPAGTTAPDLNSVSAGNYTLQVRDNNNCLHTKTVSITQASSLVVVSSGTAETCNYSNNGIASATVSGGTPAYSYLWQPGAYTSPAINNLNAGSYSLTAIDANNCSVTSIVNITEPAVLNLAFVTQKNVSCFAGSDGSLTISVSGGNSPYTYSWSPSLATTPTLNNLSAGSYIVLVRDNKSCTVTSSTSITQPASLTITGSSQSVSCFAGNNGSATVTAAGGTAPYQYFWSPGTQTVQTANSLTAGNYTATVYDAKNCSVTSIQNITQPASLTVNFTATNVSCYGGSNGIIASNVSGGSGQYVYVWSAGNQTTSSIGNLTAGIYTLNVTDDLGCTISKTTSISQSSSITVSTSFTNETCNYLNNGKADLNISGGTPSYSYLWMPGAITTKSVSNLSSGTYSVVISDAMNCTVSANVTVSEPSVLAVIINTTVPVSCFGGNNGSAQVNGTGGTANYTYSWSPNSSSSNLATNLAQGIYTVSVSDQNLCLAQQTIAIIQPSALVISAIVNSVACFGANTGSISSSVSGGNAPYNYLWLNSGSNASSISNLSSGNYSLTVSDAKSCTAAAVYNVTQASAINIAFTTTNVSCSGGNNGCINSSISGGTAPYFYNWNPGNLSSSNVSSMSAGIYTLNLTDNNACTQSKTISITQPATLSIVTSVTNESCNYNNDGKVSASASGGTAPYTYVWTPGAVPSQSVAPLASGIYTVTITDALGCVSTKSAAVSEPLPFALTFTNQVNVSCANGSDGAATVTGTGGTANYTYSWTPNNSTGVMATGLAAGIYTVIAVDQKSCTTQNTVSILEPMPLVLVPSISNVVCSGGSNGAISISTSGGTGPYSHLLLPGNVTGANFSNLSPGNYTIFSTDANSCATSTTLDINQPINFSTASSFTDAACNTQNGVASISVTSGGTAPFTYNWLPSGGTSSVSSNLYAGSYTVDVTDAMGCTSSKIVNISNFGAPVVSIVSSTNVSCYGGNDGAIEATHNTGSGPYTYSWTPAAGSSTLASGLSSGIYVLQVTDNAGCAGFVTSSLITQPSSLAVNIIPQNVSCFGGNNGQAMVSVFGGSPAYNYQWLPAASSGSTVSGLSAGQYTLIVTDSHSCALSQTFQINQPALALNATVITHSLSCFASADGSLSLIGNGGTSPYNFNTIPGNLSGASISQLAAGIYTVTVTDLHACQFTTTANIIQPAPLTLTSTALNSNCGLSNGQASVAANGGDGNYTYTWSPTGGNAAVSSALLSGSYTVTVNDGNACSTQTTQTVIDNPSPSISITQVTNVSCFSRNDGTALATVSGGSGPFTYTWLPAGGSASTGTTLSSGNYSVLVLSANNCTAISASAFVTEPAPVVTVLSSTAVNCFGGNDGTLNANISGGTPVYSFTWLPSGGNTSIASALSAGVYSVVVADTKNCTSTSTIAVTGPAAPLSLSISATDALCFGSANGSASCTASGGTGLVNFIWNPGNLIGQTVSGLAAGIYTVTASDQNNCSISGTVAINEPTALSLTTNTNNSNCSLPIGSASVSVSGGVGSYSYQWSANTSTLSNADSLMAGSYTVFVLDQNNCPANKSFSISDLPAPLVSISSVTDVTCFGSNNGMAVVTVTGGIAPFSYQWSSSVSTSSLATGLSIGYHSVTVTSANSCTVMAVSPLISQPSALAMNVITNSVACFGMSTGAATIIAAGGTPSYTITDASGANISNVLNGLPTGTYTLVLHDSFNCSATTSFVITGPVTPLDLSVINSISVSCNGGSNGSATVSAVGGTSPYVFNWTPNSSFAATASGLSAGAYTTQVTDANGCSTSTVLSVSEPTAALSAIVSQTNVSCNGGANAIIKITAAGGTPAYSYAWSPSGQTSSIATSLAAGNHSVLLSDFNNCQTLFQVQISEPAMLTGSLSVVHPSCNRSNGQISSQVAGGTSPYTYSWSPTNTNASITSSLNPGTYTLLITDGLACTKSLSTSLVNIAGPSLSLTSTKNVSCYSGNNGSATISIQQGTAPFNINWLPYGGNSITGNSLIAGSYTVIAIDNLGCEDTTNVQITEPPVLSANILSVSPALCKGANNGSISAQADGGSPGYTYMWNPTHTGANISNLPAGTYTLTVIDQKNCSTKISAIVPEPAALVASLTSVTPPLCYAADGNASVQAVGGTAPYSYSWTTTPAQLSNVLIAKAGTYTVTVTDKNGCKNVRVLEILQPTQVITSIKKSDTICAGKNGILIPSATGGSGNYHFSWQPGALTTTSNLNYTASSNITYTVLAFDDKGCAGADATSKITVFDLKPANIIVSGHSPICPGQSSAIEVQTNGNTGPVSYSWNNGLGTTAGVHIVKPNSNTTYVVNVKNICGAKLSDSVQVLISPLPIVKITSDTVKACVPELIQFRDSSGKLNSSDPIVSWLWNFNDGTYSAEQHPYHSFTEAGNYVVNVEVTTDRGCVNTSSVPVHVQAFAKPIAAFVVNRDTLDLPYDQLICTNQSTGAVTYKWEFGNEKTSTLSDPNVLLKDLGEQKITLVAYSDLGCSDTTFRYVHTDAEVIIPTAFSPNEAFAPDQAYNPAALDNDILFPYTSGVTEYSFQIFNRWGELIFESKDHAIGWNGYYRGKLCQQGVYVWKAHIVLSTGKKFDKAGNVTLIR